MGYLLVLFAAAFLLLLLAYFQQQRINADTNNALQQSVSAVQSIQNLMTDNETLRSQVADLEEQVETLTARSQELADTMEKQTRAMDLFWQVDEAYVRGRYVLCRQLIQSLEDLSDGAPICPPKAPPTTIASPLPSGIRRFLRRSSNPSNVSRETSITKTHKIYYEVICHVGYSIRS
jgi:cell division protein FtsB